MSAPAQSSHSQSLTPTILRPIELSDTSLLAEWERCGDYIEDALEYAEFSHTLEDVLRVVLAGDAQFWPRDDAALVTEIIDYPQRRTLRFWLAGGNLKTLQKLEIGAIEWSRLWGCTACEIIGRRGWVRALNGYKEAATVGVKTYE
jgi:hypothetical protein